MHKHNSKEMTHKNISIIIALIYRFILLETGSRKGKKKGRLKTVYNNIVFLVDCLSSGNPVHVDHASVVKKKRSSKVCGWICSVWLSWVWESPYASTVNSVSLSLGHSSISSFHRMAFFPSLKLNFIAYRSSKVHVAFYKFTSCDNQDLVGCIPIPAVAVNLNLKS